MDMNGKEAITDAISILEAEPKISSDHREQLAVLVASGKAKEIIGESLTQDQLKKLSEQDVENHFKGYEASKTWDAMVDKLLQLSCNTWAHFLPVDEGKLLKDLNENFMVRELGMIASGLSLNYGKYMTIASAALLTVKKCWSTLQIAFGQ